MKENTDKINAGLMRAIRLLHGAVGEKNDLEKDRQARENIGVILGKTKDIDYHPFRIDDIEAEWIRPEQPHSDKYIILYCHGGGYITGCMKYSRTITSRLASTTSMDVLAFDYSLAPEKPYPAALEDALKVWDYLMHLGYGSREVFIAGDSAGGNLALALTLKIINSHRRPPRGVLLLSPWTDMTCSGKSYTTRRDLDPILTEDYIRDALSAYVGNADPHDIYCSPVFADYTGFPPTYIQVGNNEILLNDSLSVYKLMRKAGVNVKLSIYNGMWHVFQMSPFKKANDAVDELANFIFDLIK